MGELVYISAHSPIAIDDHTITVAGDGSGPHDPGMEVRVAKLESDVGHIRDGVSEIRGVLARLAPIIDVWTDFNRLRFPIWQQKSNWLT